MKWFFRIQIILLLSTTVANTHADYIDAYNAWRNNCRKLNANFKKQLTVPYHLFSHNLAQKCTDPTGEYRWEAEKDNLYLIVANLFYYNGMSVRRRAFEMLEKYDCQKEKTCAELKRLLSDHQQATNATQPVQWRTEFMERISQIINTPEDD